MRMDATGRFLSTLAACLTGVALPVWADEVSFNRDIRPIFSENCFACHGPDRNARQADLRLDRRESALARGALVPGDAATSKLVARIRNENDVLRMPPVYSGKSLTDRQKDLLEQWIEQGAAYERHWAYLPPVRPEAPAGPAAIDFLVDRRLEEHGLEPVGPADRRTLARRLSFDLTGLPPDPSLVERFVADTGTGAAERLVDTLLASEHYGERMAVHWLDLVRYADTVGFHGDVAVSVYPYRDYVIRSFNDNKPFDEFTVEQLGGDLLSEATLDQKVASAYNRLGRMTNEGGSQAKEYLAKYAADRARTASTVWLASTMGCAECHDHKFDPFLASDFYGLQAYFADVEEEGVFAGYGNWGAQALVPNSEDRARIEAIDARIEQLREEGRAGWPPGSDPVPPFAASLGESLATWQVLEPAGARNDCSDPDIVDCDKFRIVSEPGGYTRPDFGDEARPGKVAQVVEAELPAGPAAALQLEISAAPDCEDFFLGEVAVRWLRAGRAPLTVPIRTLVPDWDDDSARLQGLVDGNHHTGWTGDPLEEGIRRAVLVFEEPFEAGEGDRLEVLTLYESIFGLHGFGYRQRLFVTGLIDFDLPVDGPRADLLAKVDWTVEERASMDRLFMIRTEGSPNWREIRSLRRERKEVLDRAGLTLVTRAVEPRTIRVLPRGNWMDDSGEEVQPHTPAFLEGLATEPGRADRLDLAGWIVDRGNPLTARVFVNRLWSLFFGTGLSKVLDDLGSQGEPPLNPDLLDWLAVEFMESGWDVKHIVRTLLLSATYQRSSTPSAALLETDPGNRLHGRQTAARLDAEFIRDNALAVSGLLNRAVGGASSKPYQPAGYYRELNFPKRVYQHDQDGRQYRRGLYTHWQRTFLHPSMKAFDAPSREECAADRPQSNTPLQSLVLLNDPTYVEAAKALAVRILESDASEDAGRLDVAYHRAFGRGTTTEEREVLSAYLADRRGHYADRPELAAEALGVGLYPVPGNLDPREVAAWMSVSRALLNKHEFVMKY